MKKLLLGLGGISAIAAPIVAVISCSHSSSPANPDKKLVADTLAKFKDTISTKNDVSLKTTPKLTKVNSVVTATDLGVADVIAEIGVSVKMQVQTIYNEETKLVVIDVIATKGSITANKAIIISASNRFAKISIDFSEPQNIFHLWLKGDDKKLPIAGDTIETTIKSKKYSHVLVDADIAMIKPISSDKDVNIFGDLVAVLNMFILPSSIKDEIERKNYMSTMNVFVEAIDKSVHKDAARDAVNDASRTIMSNIPLASLKSKIKVGDGEVEVIGKNSMHKLLKANPGFVSGEIYSIVVGDREYPHTITQNNVADFAKFTNIKTEYAEKALFTAELAFDFVTEEDKMNMRDYVVTIYKGLKASADPTHIDVAGLNVLARFFLNSFS